MKSRPILFKGEMVRALLDDRKTQTRRVLKIQPPLWVRVWNGCTGLYHFFFDRDSDDDAGNHWPSYEKGLKCPYGQPGDRLWVRETWRIGAWNEDGGEIAVDYMADNHARRVWLQVPEADDFEKYWLQCCDDCNKAGVKTDEDGKYHWEPGQSPCRIRPSIFMPRWASRITLEIVSVRVERLQDISGMDAKHEGVSVPAHMPEDGADLDWARRGYKTIWESINGAGSWDLNPWVWVIEFRRVA